MSSSTVEPRFAGGPTLPEIAGLIAGLIALAIALAPSLSEPGHDDADRGAASNLALAPVNTAPVATWPEPGDAPAAADADRAAMDRCGPDALEAAATPGAFCPLPPREPEAEEIRFVGLTFSWPPRWGASDR